jgi:putative SOS response-associated peptidase YedK
MKTINCRDDSLLEDRGMWTTMKKKKRCIIVAQGFYEWLKKNGGKEKLPHFTKRKDGQLMCFAGLWDCVQFEDSSEKLFTYTIITTDSNKQLSFLHDRMPVIFDNGSDAIRTWLDPARTEWNSELQSLLKPYEGELECYPVSKDVGKVGNSSPSFLVPINSAANKNNIANFFGNQQKAAKPKADEKSRIKVEHDDDETRATTDRVESTEDNAPLPIPATPEQAKLESKSIKRERDDDYATDNGTESEPHNKRNKPTVSASPVTKIPVKKTSTPAKKQGTRSATSNGSAAKTSKADGSRKITSFFSNK